MSDSDPLYRAIERLQSGQGTWEDLERLEAFSQDVSHQLRAPLPDDSGELGTDEALSLLDAVAAISSYREVDQVVRETAEQLARLLRVEACAISKWDPEENTITLWVEHTPPGWAYDAEGNKSIDLAAYPRTRQVLREGRAMQGHIEQPDLDPAERGFMERNRIKTLLMMPLIAEDRTIGLVELMDSRAVRVFLEREITTGKLLAKHAAIVIERAYLLKAAEQRAAELEAVRQASLSLTASLDLPQVLDAILCSIGDLIPGIHNADIFLYQEGRLMFGAGILGKKRTDGPYSRPRQHGLTHTVARQGEAVVVDDLRAHPLFNDRPVHWSGSIVGLPLKIGGRVVGVMNIAHAQEGAFAEAQLRILRLLADQAAIAIENARLHNLVIQQARTDSVTGLFNRRALDRRLEEEVRRAIRYRHPFTLVMLDLDDFKRVNDTYGHPVGDEVLQEAGKCLNKIVRETDFLARFGGDEFALVLPETDLEAAEALARRLLDALAACSLTMPDGKGIILSASIGLATYPLHASNSTSLLSAADQALYRAKRESPGSILCAGSR